MIPIDPTTAIIVGVAEIIKLGNTGLQLYFQSAAMAGKSEDEINSDFQKAKVEYAALPNPLEIPEPK